MKTFQAEAVVQWAVRALDSTPVSLLLGTGSQEVQTLVVIPGYRVGQPRPHETVSKNISPELHLESRRHCDDPVGEGSPLKERKQVAKEQLLTVVSPEVSLSCVCALGCHTSYMSSSGSQCKGHTTV